MAWAARAASPTVFNISRTLSVTASISAQVGETSNADLSCFVANTYASAARKDLNDRAEFQMPCPSVRRRPVQPLLVNDMRHFLFRQLPAQPGFPFLTAMSRCYDRLEYRSINFGSTPSISNAEAVRRMS